MQALQQRERDLAHQNMRFEAAINNMSQGLCMFDSEQRLVICNKRYADLYGTPEELVVPGTSLEDILKRPHQPGHSIRRAAPKAISAGRLDMVARKVDAADTVELQDGRMISVLHHPMADGGWVSTHRTSRSSGGPRRASAILPATMH